MSPLKPTSVRLAILAALAKNGITTLDDLQIQTGETRKKLQYSTMRAINLKLVERTQDDVTRLPAYRITPAGRKYLEKFGNGRTAEPIDPTPLAAEPQPSAPAAPAENTKQDRLEQELSDLRARHDALLARMSNVYRALGTSEDAAMTAVGSPAECVEKVIAENGLLRIKAKELEKRGAEHDTIAKQLAAWESMAKAFGCATPEQIADRISGLSDEAKHKLTAWEAMAARHFLSTPDQVSDRLSEGSAPLDIVGHVIERPAKVLTRVKNYDRAKQRSLALSKRDGKKARLYGMVLLGEAQPSTEWVDTKNG